MSGVALAIPDALEALIGPPLLPIAANAWDVFNALSATRGSSSAGVLPITYSELEAFQRVTTTQLTALDVELVRTADAAFLTEVHERAQPAERDASSEAGE